jgi:DNA-binding transcriptional LysR family regulator
MDTDLLKTFLEVHRTRHFGRAAENLYLSQSAVSARIRLLEEELRVALFTRRRNNIQLTAAGQRLLRYAENITTSWNRARLDLAVGEADLEILVVGAVPSLWDIALQEWVHWVYRAHTDIGLTTESHGVEMLLRRLQEGNTDLGFLFDAPQVADLLVVETLLVHLVMVATEPGLTAARAVSDRYVLVDWGTSFAIAHARHFPDMPTPRMRVGQGHMARMMLLECGGAAYLAEPTITEYLHTGRLHRVGDAPVIDRTAYAVYPARSERRETIERTLAYFAHTG